MLLISRGLLESCGACDEGLKWFDSHVGDNLVDCQTLIDECIKDNQDTYAMWLYKRFSMAYSNITRTEGVFNGGRMTIILGNLHANRSIDCKGLLYVSGSLVARDSIEAHQVFCDYCWAGDVIVKSITTKRHLNVTNLSVQDDAQAGTTILVGNSARCDTLRADKDITIGGDLIADTVVSSEGIIVDGDVHIKSLISAGHHLIVRGTLYDDEARPAKLIAGCRITAPGRVEVENYAKNNKRYTY